MSEPTHIVWRLKCGISVTALLLCCGLAPTAKAEPPRYYSYNSSDSGYPGLPAKDGTTGTVTPSPGGPGLQIISKPLSPANKALAARPSPYAKSPSSDATPSPGTVIPATAEEKILAARPSPYANDAKQAVIARAVPVAVLASDQAAHEHRAIALAGSEANATALSAAQASQTATLQAAAFTSAKATELAAQTRQLGTLSPASGQATPAVASAAVPGGSPAPLPTMDLPLPAPTKDTSPALLPAPPELPSTPKIAVAPLAVPASPVLVSPAPVSLAPAAVIVKPTPPAAVADMMSRTTPPAVVVQPAAISEEPAPELSRESKAIVKKLPPEKSKREIVKPPVTVEHFQKNPLEVEEIRKHESIGISISVRKPRPNITHQLEEAYDALIAGNQTDAINLYKQVLEEQPENKLALFGLATTYHRAGQLQLARPIYGRLLAIDPKNAEGLNNFLVLLSDEAPAEALEEMKKLEQSHPDFSPLPAQMAVVYEKLGNYDVALKKMRQAIDMSPENIKYRYDLAVILDKQGDWENAAVIYQQLLTASDRGEKIPVKPEEIQERLTFIRSNKPKS